MKGKKCKCGFASLTKKPRCPRCGKVTADAEWKDTGKVLSAAKLKKAPNGFNVPMALAVVEVDGKGPKIACWSEDELSAGDAVAVVDMGGLHVCERQAPKAKQAHSAIGETSAREN